MNLEALYDQLPPERQGLLDEVNFLAGNLREDLILEQFYLALEALSARLQQLHPQIACPTGCSRCCETHALPEVLPMEWELIKAALETLPNEISERLRTAVRSGNWPLDAEGQLKGRRRDYPNCSCPLLLDGRCSVYPWRPFDCRVTGYAFSNAGERPLPPPGPPPGQLLPYSCSSEQRRMLTELAQGIRPLEYMFLPQREQLWEVLQLIEPGDTGPRLLLAHLQDWATGSTAGQTIPDA
ncbi:MAG: hypothetical protein CVV27_07745 [Candidatus Melainabacteria bacterium HGW-Melainabacteria-1]|nr:MAG: hypothetical protein CVV27_07745 [Candidatus Melainabacteria bacterium HGW-Melainabacteria-1]